MFASAVPVMPGMNSAGRGSVTRTFRVRAQAGCRALPLALRLSLRGAACPSSKTSTHPRSRAGAPRTGRDCEAVELLPCCGTDVQYTANDAAAATPRASSHRSFRPRHGVRTRSRAREAPRRREDVTGVSAVWPASRRIGKSAVREDVPPQASRATNTGNGYPASVLGVTHAEGHHSPRRWRHRTPGWSRRTPAAR
jgi:hypothetical protein